MGSDPRARQIAKGDRRVLARALTQAENGSGDIDLLLAAIEHGTAHRVGITGAPGVGKSTLVSALTRAWRAQDRKVGILAVDPSSPFTGGALLGDRVRMVEHTGDEGVFIRSLATRGALGGLAPGVYDAADLLDAGGFDPVVIETVGVGQAELEICRAADTTVLVLAPGAGDEVQGMKAGLLEAADVLVVNQADRDGAQALATALEAALDLRQADRPRPPVLLTTATAAKGIDALCDVLDERARDADGALADRRVERAAARVRAALYRRLDHYVEGRGAELAAAAARIAAGESTAAVEAELLMDDYE
ncbi:MAG: methylmalonyl Co-A mutase-associated GTPase MeaB [Planctomycetota bacterium]|nr:methylmalonyl Co-A mutase-associated GTPase MeaB [Planctomycetota bacterium]